MTFRASAPPPLAQVGQFALPGVVHAVTTRESGNLSLAVGDDPAEVRRRRRALAEGLGIEPGQIVCAEQVHGTVVARVGRAERGRGAWSREDAIPGADALVTDEPGVFLTLLFADCVPVLLVDPRRRAVGVAHAGWRGTAGRIAARIVETMRDELGSHPSDLRAAIGPAIGGCCYEVSDEVADAVLASLGGRGRGAAAEDAHWLGGSRGRASVLLVPDGRGQDVAAPDRRGDEGASVVDGVVYAGPRRRPHVDLAEANREQLIAAGLPAENVELSGDCTSCRVDRFFSHRAEQGRAGRHAAILGLT